jgi:hypothetical protein
MNLVQKLLDTSNGLHYRQEYLCLAKETFQQPLRVYIVEKGKPVQDVTELHCFVGYCPLIIALPSGIVSKLSSATIQLIFTLRPLEQNETFPEKDAVGRLELRKILQQSVDDSIVSFYEGTKGHHHFLSGFHQSVIRLHNRWYGRKAGNVFLRGNLYDQVQIGYAVPRKICLITVGENGQYNHFPTDLHGQIDREYYLISLRHTGNACKQVDTSGKIVLSDMDVNSYKRVYALGKNHMQPLKERWAFDFSSNDSKNFHLPLPKEALSYKELETVSSFIAGIHKLILFRVVYEEKINPRESTLVHIHNCYATWRNRQGIEGDYLLR